MISASLPVNDSLSLSSAFRSGPCSTYKHRRRCICVATAPLQRPAHRWQTDDVVTVREPHSNAELEEAARIRADCFYEAMVPVPRFAASLADKMAREEYRGLLHRTAIQPDGRLSCICLVAVRPGECVCGSLDLRLPAEASGVHPPGVPEDDPGGAFLVNVSVHQRFRGQGIGRTLISAALQAAAHQMMAKRVYTHVDCDNDAAWRLYQQHGFDIHDDAACSLPGGRLVLVSHLTTT